jgi:hypothetical protein
MRSNCVHRPQVLAIYAVLEPELGSNSQLPCTSVLMQQLVSRSNVLLQRSFTFLHGNYARSVSKSLELSAVLSCRVSNPAPADASHTSPYLCSSLALNPKVFDPAGQHSCSGGALIRQGCCPNLEHSVSSSAAGWRCDSASGRQCSTGRGRAGINTSRHIQGKLSGL